MEATPVKSPSRDRSPQVGHIPIMSRLARDPCAEPPMTGGGVKALSAAT